MSMKIWNGIKFKSDNPEEIVSQLNSIKKRAVENSKKYITQGRGAAQAVYVSGYTKDTVFDINVKDYKQLHEFREKLEFSFSKRFRSWDDPAFKFTVVVIPYNGHLYGISYHEEIEENRALLEPFIEEYHYQNQTDKPEDIDDEEWDERSDIWNEIFDKYVAPSDAGFTYEIVKSDDLEFDDIRTLVTNYRDQFADGYIVCCTPKTKDEKSEIWEKFRDADFASAIADIPDIHINDDWRRRLSTVTYISFITPSEDSKNRVETIMKEQFSDILKVSTTFEKVRKDWLGLDKEEKLEENN